VIRKGVLTIRGESRKTLHVNQLDIDKSEPLHSVGRLVACQLHLSSAHGTMPYTLSNPITSWAIVHATVVFPNR
jgi:hypothetical protein